MTRLEHARLNVFKSLINTVNQICPEFVVLNKQETYQKLDRNALDKIKDFGKQGFYFNIFVILVLLII